MSQHSLDLSIEEVERIVSFLGYGRTSAPVWFIGFEEGLGDMSDEEVIKNCKSRGRFERVMDLYEAHLDLFQNGLPINLEVKPPRTQVWQYMAKIMLAREGITTWDDKKKVRDYIRLRLGRKNSDTFLTELSPIPTKRNSDNSWRVKLTKIDNDLPSKIAQRKEELRRLLRENSRRLVVCYGLKQKTAFSELLGIDWKFITNDIFTSENSRCLLLPFFGNGQMKHTVIEHLMSNNLLHT